MARRVFWIVRIRFMFRPVNFVTEDVRHDKFFHESGLEDVPKSIQRGYFLRFADETDDLVNVIH